MKGSPEVAVIHQLASSEKKHCIWRLTEAGARAAWEAVEER